MSELPEALESLRATLERLLRRHGVPAPRAAQIAADTTEEFRREWGGMEVYIPKGLHARVERRNREILARYDGANARELCREHNISLAQLRRILAAARGDPRGTS